MHQITPEERKVFRVRKKQADSVIRELVRQLRTERAGTGVKAKRGEEMPTIGLACSGGGIRAMLSSVGCFDALRETGLLGGSFSCLTSRRITRRAHIRGGALGVLLVSYEVVIGRKGHKPFSWHHF
jgi:hypothetical protein